MKINLPQMGMVVSIVLGILTPYIAIAQAQENGDRPPISVQSVAWSPDGSMIAVGRGTDRCHRDIALFTIQILDVTTGQVKQNLSGSTCTVSSVDWSPDGSSVAAASHDSIGIRVWDMENGQIVTSAQTPGQASISVRWSPDSTMLATTDAGGGILILDAATGETISIPATLGSHIDWSPDGSRLVSGRRENQLQIADITTGHRVMVIGEGMGSVDWSPDGNKIASSALDNSARIWDAQSGESLFILRGHTDFVTEVSWSLDSSRLATSSNDGTVRIWGATTGEELEIFEYPGRVFTVDWSPDGDRLAYGGYRSDGQDAEVEIVELSSSSTLPAVTPVR